MKHLKLVVNKVEQRTVIMKNDDLRKYQKYNMEMMVLKRDKSFEGTKKIPLHRVRKEKHLTHIICMKTERCQKTKTVHQYGAKPTLPGNGKGLLTQQ
jgi:hypothetical protein